MIFDLLLMPVIEKIRKRGNPNARLYSTCLVFLWMLSSLLVFLFDIEDTECKFSPTFPQIN